MSDEPTPENREDLSRRKFIQAAAQAAAGLAFVSVASCAESAPAPSKRHEQAPSKSPRKPGEKIRMGWIGTGQRGGTLLTKHHNHPEIEVKAVCDVNKLNLEKAAGIVKTDQYEEYEKLLERDDIDAVVIATPEHWHAIMTIHACQAGKDVYVEKPLALCIEEGRRMVEAARKHGRIVQMGTQQNSGPFYQKAAAMIKAGEIGQVALVKTWDLVYIFPGKGNEPDQDNPPPHLNWDRWLGPRPFRKYNAMREHLTREFFYDYSGGLIADMGTHHFHTMLHCLDYPTPVKVSASGGRYYNRDITDTPDTLAVLYQFPNMTLEYNMYQLTNDPPRGSNYGVEFCGTGGNMFIDRRGLSIGYRSPKKESLVQGNPGGSELDVPNMDEPHMQNFLDCVRSRRPPVSEVELGHRATIISHLGNIAYLTGRQIEWDPVMERIKGDSGANNLLRREYRVPYLLPVV